MVEKEWKTKTKVSVSLGVIKVKLDYSWGLFIGKRCPCGGVEEVVKRSRLVLVGKGLPVRGKGLHVVDVLSCGPQAY